MLSLYSSAERPATPALRLRSPGKGKVKVVKNFPCSFIVFDVQFDAI